ncbi:MAG: SEC-C domain-containing protein [Chlamydiales bacterium]|nr:SEC-C domain-containing protein [Chlamydiales bacterium]
MGHIQRNHPCFCGSNKKYKHCCFSKTIDNDEWKKLQDDCMDLLDKILTDIEDNFDEALILDAWDEFYCEKDLELESDTIESSIFFANWLVFEWIPHDCSSWSHLEKDRTLAEIFCKKQGYTDKDFILQAFANDPYTFFVVEDVISAHVFVLKDLLLDRLFIAKSVTSFTSEFRGVVLFGKTITLNNEIILINYGTPLPEETLRGIVDLKKDLTTRLGDITAEVLIHGEASLREYFLSLLYEDAEEANEDDWNEKEDFLFYKCPYPPQEAFDRLTASLQQSDRDKFLDGGLFDRNGVLVSVDIPLTNKSIFNGIIGKIEIWKDTLSVEVDPVHIEDDPDQMEKIKNWISMKLPNTTLNDDTFLQNGIPDDEEEDDWMFNKRYLSYKSPYSVQEIFNQLTVSLQAFDRDQLLDVGLFDRDGTLASVYIPLYDPDNPGEEFGKIDIDWEGFIIDIEPDPSLIEKVKKTINMVLPDADLDDDDYFSLGDVDDNDDDMLNNQEYFTYQCPYTSQETFDRLTAALQISNRDELLDDAYYDDDGVLFSVDVPLYDPAFPNEKLGIVDINDEIFFVDVDSNPLLIEKVKKIISAALPEAVLNDEDVDIDDVDFSMIIKDS